MSASPLGPHQPTPADRGDLKPHENVRPTSMREKGRGVERARGMMFGAVKRLGKKGVGEETLFCGKGVISAMCRQAKS